MPYPDSYFPKASMGDSYGFAALFKPGGSVFRVYVGCGEFADPDMVNYFLDRELVTRQSSYIRDLTVRPVPVGTGNSSLPAVHVLACKKERKLVDVFPHFIHFAYTGYYVTTANEYLRESHGHPKTFEDLGKYHKNQALFSKNDAQKHRELRENEIREHVLVYCLADRLSAAKLKVYALKQLKEALNRICIHVNVPTGEKYNPNHCPREWIVKYHAGGAIGAAKIISEFLPEEQVWHVEKNLWSCAADVIAEAMVRLVEIYREQGPEHRKVEVYEYLKTNHRFINRMMSFVRDCSLRDRLNSLKKPPSSLVKPVPSGRHR